MDTSAQIIIGALAVIGAFGGALSGDFFSYYLLKSKYQQERFLELLGRLDGANSQAVLVGVSHELLKLAKEDTTYIRRSTLVLECAIREYSERTLSAWLKDIHEDLSAAGKSLKVGKPTGNSHRFCSIRPRPRTPGLSEVIDVVIKLREWAKSVKETEKLPKLDLSNADLRDVSPKNLPYLLENARLDKVDLRHVKFAPSKSLPENPNKPGEKPLLGAWVDWGVKRAQDDGGSRENEGLKHYTNRGAALFLEGDWSGSPQQDKNSGDSKNGNDETINQTNRWIAGGPGVNLDNVDLRGFRFSHGHFMGASFKDAIFDGNDFSHADVSGADFTGVKTLTPEMFRGARTFLTRGEFFEDNPTPS